MNNRVAVLKGFVWGVNWGKPEHRRIVNNVTRNLKNYSAVAWDGDLLKNDSFTRVLFHIMQTYPNKKYITFKKEKHVGKLNAGHVENNKGKRAAGYPRITKSPINVRKTPSNIGWRNLGIWGIKNLKNSYKNVDIYFLGQGQVALNEEETLKTMKIPGVNIKKHYNVSR